MDRADVNCLDEFLSRFILCIAVFTWKLFKRVNALSAGKTSSNSGADTRIGLAAAAVWACTFQVLIDAVFIFHYHLASPSFDVRVLHHVFDAGHHLALGILAAVTITAVKRLMGARPAAGYLLLSLIMITLGAIVLPEDLTGVVARHSDAASAPWLSAALVVCIAQTPVIASFFGLLFFNRRRWRWWAQTVGIVMLVSNHLILPGDYDGIHFFLAFGALTFMATSMSNARRFVRIPMWLKRGAFVLLLIYSALSVTVNPGPRVRLALLNVDGAVVPPLVSRIKRASSQNVAVQIPEYQAEWFVLRDRRKPISPSSETLLPKNGIVILLVVDSLRADYLYAENAQRRYPNMRRICKTGVDFTRTRAPGSQTVVTISSVFAGKYFSQLYWELHPIHPDYFPHADKTRGFPEVLADAGIATLNLAAVDWMTNAWGVVRGFEEEEKVIPRQGTQYAVATEVLTTLKRRLEKHDERPLFVFAQLFDAHGMISQELYPERNRMEQYRGGLAHIDNEIGSLLRFLGEQGLSDRTAIVLTSDHGEALGDHGVYHHAVNLYEELVRVPLCILLARAAPRKVETPVSLMDLAPTVVDLMGGSIPGEYMGQSLVGFLAGKSPNLSRPIAAEGRLKQMMVFDDSMKVIVDNRVNTIEAYHLSTDPNETDNIIDIDKRANEGRALLRRFFDIHEYKRAGYETPFRK